MTTKKDISQKRLVYKFLQVFALSFIILVLIAAAATTAYVVIAKKDLANSLLNNAVLSSNKNGGNGTSDAAIEALMAKPFTTVAIFGVDKDGYRTDVTMLAFFNHKTADIDIISIPRDTQIKIPDDIYETIKERRSDVKQVLKINEVPAYVEKEERNETSVKVIEETFGVDIDYYVNLDLDGFKYIVDNIGGVPMDIPIDMKYSDPLQDLYINLDRGIQTLNGTQAEQLIRFRKGYANGDIGRIDMQHLFMKSFVEQLLTVKNRLNIVNIATTVLTYVNTDFVNVIDYLTFMDQITPEKIHLSVLPGEVNEKNRTYYTYNYDETKSLFNSILNGEIRQIEAATNATTSAIDDGTSSETTGASTDTTTETSASSTEEIKVDVQPEKIIDATTLKISVQNGTTISGFAGKTKTKLVDAGYTVVESINYEQKPVTQTKLIVPSKEVGTELSEQFNKPIVEVDETLLGKDIEVIIILGESDGNQ